MGELIEIPKRVTWTSLISDLKVSDEPLKTAYSNQRSISPLISHSIKVKFPDRIYTTYKEVETVTEDGFEKEVEYLRIKRTK
ncbi:MAG TPA: hypothetical protein VK541_05000 [Pedobacter sp.]|uniref:hypothetical protein n=1 Tax=Pedobacter sp. TaxID=1411316 RepID=UPI002C859E36|nr:hypothetical protein [Pedobacter sp.]HMI01817.1 hypothetical protein [Pedobacter sp.]